MPAALPDPLPIRPRGPLAAIARPPGSRSIANRAQVAAALASGESLLCGVTASDDTDAMREGLAALGVAMERAGDEDWRVRGCAGRFQPIAGAIDVRASGTTARFLTAAATLAATPVVLDGTPRMRERPIADLVEALRALGGSAEVLGARGCPPVRAGGGAGLAGGEATLDVRRSSSQYVSGILLTAPYARRDVVLRFVGDEVISRPFVELTLAVMRDFGAEAEFRGPGCAFVRAGRGYQGREYRVEPDAQGAVYAFAAAAIAGGQISVPELPRDSLQPDLGFLDALVRMGCSVERGERAITLRAAQRLRGITVDANPWPDAALALAVVALFAEGPTTIENVPNLRIKETDRLAALERELAKLGARATAGPDWLRIEPGPLHGAEIDTYDDHRMAMSFALAGLRIAGVAIRDPGCVRKTWPGFFEALASWA